MSEVGHLALDGEINIYRAAELKLEILAALRAAPVLDIDLAGVTELDTAGLQVLMLAKRTATLEQRELRLSHHSPAVVEVVELLNLGAFFGDAVLIHR